MMASAKYDGDQKYSPPRVLAVVSGEFLPWPTGRQAIAGACEAGQGDFRLVVHERVHVTGLAVKLAEFRAKSARISRMIS